MVTPWTSGLVTVSCLGLESLKTWERVWRAVAAAEGSLLGSPELGSEAWPFGTLGQFRGGILSSLNVLLLMARRRNTDGWNQSTP